VGHLSLAFSVLSEAQTVLYLVLAAVVLLAVLVTLFIFRKRK